MLPSPIVPLAAALALVAGTATAQDNVKNGPAGVTAAGPATDWGSFVPPTDGSFTTWGEAPPDIGLVKRVFALTFAEECGWALGSTDAQDPDVHDLSYRYGYETDADPAHALKLYRFFCNAGAYNEVHVYMSWDQSWGLRPLSFAEPSLDLNYVSDDSLEGAVESISIAGYVATHLLVNSDYDPASQSIVSFSKWRGIGDASSSGTYSFREGNFVLTRYEADPSYDGEINPYLIVDTSRAHPIELMPVGTE